MPPKPLKPCNHPGCRALTVNRHCDKHIEQHKPKPWQKRRETPRTITGRALQEARRQLFIEEPICMICGIEPSAVRDHILSLLEGGADTRENTQGLCKNCHNRKIGQESARGRRR